MKINNFSKNDIKFIEVTNRLGFKVIFSDLGASIFLVRDNEYVLNRNVKNIDDFKNTNQYYGKTIGRVSNRIRGHKIKLNGAIYTLNPNEGANTLHGGLTPLSDKYFDVDVKSDEEKATIVYNTIIKEEEDGFPGDLDVTVEYVVYENKKEIDIYYSATCSNDSVVSLTNHAYWTLGNKSIKGLSLKIDSHKYLSTDENLLPKKINEVDEVFDFSTSRKICEKFDSEELHKERLNGYDHFFYFDEVDTNKAQCVLSNSKYEMEVYTNFEGLQIYTSGFDNGYPLYPECEPLFNSVAIEPSDSFLKLRLLKKDEVYSRFIKYIFNEKREN